MMKTMTQFATCLSIKSKTIKILYACISALISSCVFGNANTINITGNDAKPLHPSIAPWFVTFIEPDKNHIPTAVCGGTLIDNTHVITAAHCVCCSGEKQGKPIPIDKKYLQLVLPASDKQQIIWGQKEGGTTKIKGKILTISKIIVHPKYQDGGRGSNTNDIAILTLESPAKVNLFPSLDDGKYSKINQPNLYVTGFGARSGSHVYPYKPSLVAYYVENQTLSAAQCQTKYLPRSEFPPITNKMICGYNPNGSDCVGDSGGPLFFSNQLQMNYETIAPPVLVGIVSWGGAGCQAGAADVFTKISEYNNWIKQTVSGNSD